MRYFLPLLLVAILFTSCQKTEMETTDLYGDVKATVVGVNPTDVVIGEDPFEFEGVASKATVSTSKGEVSINGWSKYKSRSNANFDFEYYAVDGASYIRPNGNTRKISVLVLAYTKGTSDLVKYSLRIYDNKKVNLPGTNQTVIVGEVEAAVLAYSYPFNTNQVVLLTEAGFSKGDIDAVGNVHYTKTANEITIGVAKIAVGDINLYGEGVDESHQNLRTALYIANSHFGPIGGDSTGNSLIRRNTFAVGEIAILRDAGFEGDVNLGTLRWTNEDVHIDFHYYNGTEWVTVSTPGRTGASSRGWARDEPGQVAVAVAYATSLLSNDAVFANDIRIFLNEGGWTRSDVAQGDDNSYTQYVDADAIRPTYLQVRSNRVLVDSALNGKRKTLYNVADLRQYLLDLYAGALRIVLPSDEQKWLAEAGYVLVGQSESRYRFQKNRTSPSQQCNFCVAGVNDDHRIYIDVHKNYTGYLVAGTDVVTARSFPSDNVRGAISRANSFLTITKAQEDRLARGGFVRQTNGPSTMSWLKGDVSFNISLDGGENNITRGGSQRSDGSESNITIEQAFVLLAI